LNHNDLVRFYAALCSPLQHPHFPTLNRLVEGSIPSASTNNFPLSERFAVAGANASVFESGWWLLCGGYCQKPQYASLSILDLA
jgi:hypothetical protein